MDNLNKPQGFVFAFIAFFIWGLVPIFWKQLDHFNSIELLGHRTIWGVVFLTIYLLSMGEFKKLKLIWETPQRLKLLLLSTLFIFANWLLFIWAVNNEHILEVSLGYFINPLLNVFLGTIFLKESLRPFQWGCVALAFIGVLILAFGNEGSPWISIVLASTFGFYGLIRKKAGVPSTIGLCFEMLLVSIPIFIYFMWAISNGSFLFSKVSWQEQVFVLSSGIVTIAPLLAFGKAVVNLKYSTLGLMQYLAPSLQFLVGVYIFKENFSLIHKYSFGLIWMALLFYSLEGGYFFKSSRRENV